MLKTEKRELNTHIITPNIGKVTERKKTQEQIDKEKKKFDSLEHLTDLSGAGVSDMMDMCNLTEYLFQNGCYSLKKVKDSGSCAMPVSEDPQL